jgi:hypothetical protein
MSISSNVPTGISKPDSANAGTKIKNGARCHDTSCTCGRGRSAGHRATSLGQKVTSDLFLRNKQDQAKYNLLMFMTRLLGLYGSKI